MKILTFWQPWGWCIAHHEKRVENRPWRTNYRGPIAIHAGKKVDLDASDFLRGKGIPVPYRLVQGAVVALANLSGCERYQEGNDDMWAHGPICWLIDDVRRLPEPIPWRGRQGLTDAPADLVAAIEKALDM